jgi:hypothetical protein
MARRHGKRANSVDHAEGHAAAIMRTRGIQEATLYLNNEPCGDPARRDAPPLVELVMADTNRTLDIGLSRPDYSVLIWHDDDADEILASTGDLNPGSDAAFDFGGTWTHIADHSAIPVELARQAAREFAATGLRPTRVKWQTPAYTT